MVIKISHSYCKEGREHIVVRSWFWDLTYRCFFVLFLFLVGKDAYVLCRIFQKSGSGPKNGEQYGAPFVEEEWENDALVVVPGEEARGEEAADDDSFLDANDIEQVCDIFESIYTLSSLPILHSRSLCIQPKHWNYDFPKVLASNDKVRYEACRLSKGSCKLDTDIAWADTHLCPIKGAEFLSFALFDSNSYGSPYMQLKCAIIKKIV